MKSPVRSMGPLAILIAIASAQGCTDNSGLADLGTGGKNGMGGTTAETSDGGEMGTNAGNAGNIMGTGGALANAGGTASKTGGTNGATGGTAAGGKTASGGSGGKAASGGGGGKAASGGTGGKTASGGSGGTVVSGGTGGIAFTMCQPGVQCSANAMCAGLCQVSTGLSGSRDCSCVDSELECGQCRAAACAPGVSCQGFPTSGYATAGTTVDNCAGMTHQTDCCGARKVFGINHGERAKLCIAEAVVCVPQYMQNASCSDTAITTDTGETSTRIDRVRVRCNPAVLGSCECQTFVCNSEVCRDSSRPIGSCGG